MTEADLDALTRCRDRAELIARLIRFAATEHPDLIREALQGLFDCSVIAEHQKRIEEKHGEVWTQTEALAANIREKDAAIRQLQADVIEQHRRLMAYDKRIAELETAVQRMREWAATLAPVANGKAAPVPQK